MVWNKDSYGKHWNKHLSKGSTNLALLFAHINAKLALLDKSKYKETIITPLDNMNTLPQFTQVSSKLALMAIFLTKEIIRKPLGHPHIIPHLQL